MHSRLLTLQLQRAHAEARLGNVLECESALNEALATSRSIAAIFQNGNGNGSTTLDTTQELLTLSGTTQDNLGSRGSSQLGSSDFSERAE